MGNHRADRRGPGRRPSDLPTPVATATSEVGKRKPHPAIYEAVLSELDVAPERSLFVGDRLVEDVRGPAALGMTTVQAVWFRADENPDGIEPDYQAFTQMDVLNVVERLRQAAWGSLG